MAGRNIKKGLEFAAWDTDIFDNDPKMDELIDACGWTGFSVYFWLCTRAYAGEGYYYEWDYSKAATTARKMGGEVSSELVRNVVATCIEIGLFDKALAEQGILTSRGIQKRYVRAIERRNKRNVTLMYWLLTQEESGNCITVVPEEQKSELQDKKDTDNSISVYKNGISADLASDNISKVKESKVEEDEDIHAHEDELVSYAYHSIVGMNGGNMDVLLSYRDDGLPDEVIRHAIDAGCAQGVPKWHYIKAILDEYLEYKCFTLQKVSLHEEAFKNRNKQAEQSTEVRRIRFR